MERAAAKLWRLGWSVEAIALTLPQRYKGFPWTARKIKRHLDKRLLGDKRRPGTRERVR